MSLRTAFRRLGRPALIASAVLLSLAAGAQPAAPAPAPAPAPASAPAAPPPALPASASAAAPVAAPAAAAAASAPAAVAPPASLVDARQCASDTDQASAADMQAATVQSQRGDLALQADLLDQAIRHWTQAVATCDARARDRARRNLRDTQRQRSAVTELQGSGAQCESTQKNASSLQDLARQAMSDRRWVDAAVLFHKAEGQWELASERCTGTQRQLASQRREQSEIDGHNAEFCAPLFDKAREFTQRLRSGQAAMAPADRQKQSQTAETLWRDALPQCRGSAQDLARTNAENLARERGTAWVPNRPSVTASAGTAALTGTAAAMAGGTAMAPGAALAGTTTGAAAAATAARLAVSGGSSRAPSPSTPAEAKPVSATVAAALAAATGVQPAAAKPIQVTLADGTRFTGLFSLDDVSRTYSGTGQIQWTNGDLYDGELVRGKRHGKGEFRWPSGQVYKGDWVDDQPHGQGTLRSANGNLYEGPLVQGVPEGEGAMVYASGDIYKGSLRAGQPDGAGVYTWTSGQRCQCQWTAGQATGRGSLRFANGNQYDGPLHNGQPQGKGKLVFATGEVYEGQFEKGQFEGQGSYRWKNGDQFVGAWVEGIKEGPGVMTWANGDRWEGLYRADAQTEQGQLKRK